MKLETDAKTLADTLLPAGTALEHGSTMAGFGGSPGCIPFSGMAPGRSFEPDSPRYLLDLDCEPECCGQRAEGYGTRSDFSSALYGPGY